jgi:hypothetical protein
MVGYIACVQNNGVGTRVDFIDDLGRREAPEDKITFNPLAIGIFPEGVDNRALKTATSERSGKIGQTDGHIHDSRREDIITLNNKIGID